MVKHQNKLLVTTMSFTQKLDCPFKRGKISEEIMRNYKTYVILYMSYIFIYEFIILFVHIF